MRGQSIFLSRFRAVLCEVSSLLVIFLAIVCSIALAIRGKELDTRYLAVAVNEDEGVLSEEFLKLLEKEPSLRIERKDAGEAIALFRQGRTPCVFFIRSDFTEKLENGSYEDLVGFRNSQDSLGDTVAAEAIINECLRIWAEEYIASDLETMVSLSEEEKQEFHKEAERIFGEEVSVRVEPKALGSTADELSEGDGGSGSAAAWYGILAFFYVFIGSTYMIRNRKSGIYQRIEQKGTSAVPLVLLQGLPLVLIAFAGAVPVIFLSGGNAALLLAFALYLIAGLGGLLLLGSVCGNLLSLVFLSLVVAGGNAVISGLMVSLPAWTGAWNVIRLIFPGTWLLRGLSGEPFFFGGLLCAMLWMCAGILTMFLSGMGKRRSK